MTSHNRHRQLVVIALAGAVLLPAAPAGADTRNVLDLSAGAGLSTNPGVNGHGSTSGFGRISAYGDHSWTTERSSTSIHGFLENTSYFKGGYGSQRIFNVGADTNFTVSPTLSLYGNLYFFGDFNGQLSNRLISVPSAPPPVITPGLPPPTTVSNFFAFGGHSYQVSGQVGASIRSSELSTISVSAGAQHGWYSHNSFADHTTYFGSLGYSRQISERTSIGPSIYVTHQDYTQGSSNIINPTLTAHTQLSETVTADGALGVLVVDDHRFGVSDTRVSPSFRLGVCGQGTVSSICAHVARDAYSAFSNPTTIGSQASITTTADLSYYRRVSDRGTVQASLAATHSSDSTAGPNALDLRQTYVRGIVGYDQGIGHRLFAGVNVGARKAFQSGPDPKADFNANIYLRYRLGDLQ